MVTKATREEDPITCENTKRRSLILTPDAWAVIRGDIQANCVMRQCAEIKGKLDQLFLDVDRGLNKIPW